MSLNALQTSADAENMIGTRPYTRIDGVLAPHDIAASRAQKQTQEVFGFKWKKEDTFNSNENLTRMKNWLMERYGDPARWLAALTSGGTTVMDAGCGAGMSGFEYWGPVADKIDFVGVDISEAIYVAAKRAQGRNFRSATFLQESLDNMPFTGPEFDIIFSEGVLHHTDSTEKTFSHLCQFLKPGGLFMFYVYRQKSPIREFTDDYIRTLMQDIPPEQGWEDLKGLTALGIELGKLDIEIDVPQDVKFLDIPAGKINLQRLFYWNIFKAFYDPKLNFDEMHHINFDWYAPKNAHRHTVDETRAWCAANGLTILSEKEEPAGITCIAQKG